MTAVRGPAVHFLKVTSGREKSLTPLWQRCHFLSLCSIVPLSRYGVLHLSISCPEEHPKRWSLNSHPSIKHGSIRSINFCLSAPPAFPVPVYLLSCITPRKSLTASSTSPSPSSSLPHKHPPCCFSSSLCFPPGQLLLLCFLHPFFPPLSTSVFSVSVSLFQCNSPSIQQTSLAWMS